MSSIRLESKEPTGVMLNSDQEVLTIYYYCM